MTMGIMQLRLFRPTRHNLPRLKMNDPGWQNVRQTAECKYHSIEKKQVTCIIHIADIVSEVN